MNIGVIGISHKEASVEIREKFAFTESQKVEVMTQLLDLGLDEVVILSTCNRSEVYFGYTAQIDVIQDIRLYILTFFNDIALESYLFERMNEAAISHLFEVASGLDSIILGEDQILGQVKDALEFAIKIGSSKKFLNRIFRDAISFAKKVKMEYKISENPLSTASVAIKHLSKSMTFFQDAHVMVIGTGEMGRLCIQYLHDYGVKHIYVCNRTICKTDELEKIPNIIYLPYEERYEYIPVMDALISATASPHIIIKNEEFPILSKQIILVDMAVPLDIEPTIGNLPQVKLIDIDDLKGITEDNIKYREKIADLVRVRILDEVISLNLWIQQTSVDSIIESFQEICQDSKEDTMLLINKKLKLSSREYAYVDKLIHAALKRVLREPIRQLKTLDNKEEIKSYKEMIHRLFDF